MARCDFVWYRFRRVARLVSSSAHEGAAFSDVRDVQDSRAQSLAPVWRPPGDFGIFVFLYPSMAASFSLSLTGD